MAIKKVVVKAPTLLAELAELLAQSKYAQLLLKFVGVVANAQGVGVFDATIFDLENFLVDLWLEAKRKEAYIPVVTENSMSVTQFNDLVDLVVHHPDFDEETGLGLHFVADSTNPYKPKARQEASYTQRSAPKTGAPKGKNLLGKGLDLLDNVGGGLRGGAK